MRGTALLDEWQEVPEVLPAVKRAVDSGAAPGRFLLTGSMRSDSDAGLWPGTGRLIRLPMGPLTRGEIDGHGPAPSTGLLSRLRAEGPAGVKTPHSPPDLPGYLALSVIGGMPPQLDLSGAGRRRWYLSYLDQLATQDARATGERPDPARLRAYLRSLAECSAGLPTATTLYESAGINARTAAGYDRLLIDLGVLDAVPAWTSNRLKRSMLRRKLYLTDAGPTAAALSVDATDLMCDGAHLEWLRDRLGKRFVAGLVLHTGPGLFTLSDRVVAAPIACLWEPA